MNHSKEISASRMLAMMAVLLGAMVLPAYGQQEVDPSWFDPWTPPAAAVVQSAKPSAAIHKQQQTTKPVATTRVIAKARAKRSANRVKQS